MQPSAARESKKGVGDMAEFQIEDYRVNAWRGQGSSVRLIQITSVALAHGIRHRAAIYFVDSPPATLGFVSNVDQPNFNGYYAVANWHKSDFAEIYDVLRSELPVSFLFFYTPPGYDPNDPNRDLTFTWFYTGDEPVGEGPAEPVSVVSILDPLGENGVLGTKVADGDGEAE
jgi:hypothetical protein